MIIHKSVKKMKLVVTEKVNFTHDETYCILTLQIFRFNMIFMAINFLFFVLEIVEVCSMDKFSKFFLTQRFLECAPHSLLNAGVYTVIKEILFILRDILRHMINILQIQEWQCILYLIKTQHNRNVGQILYDYNMEERVSENVRLTSIMGLERMDGT